MKIVIWFSYIEQGFSFRGKFTTGGKLDEEVVNDGKIPYAYTFQIDLKDG